MLAAQTAFYDELIDFFRSRGRTDRSTAVAKQAEVIELAVAKLQADVENIDAAEMISGAMSGSLPALSA